MKKKKRNLQCNYNSSFTCFCHFQLLVEIVLSSQVFEKDLPFHQHFAKTLE
ncbi:unnamed protein product [Larinioides sclopetarius]|uniref:Uncharacterized protein n=1 Tax=Larinioides sclopetarius TaxID=280406 RepID=A0AAV2BUG9_9ARAC